MNSIFTIDEKMNVSVDPTILMIEPFKTIWERDETRKKTNAHRDFVYISLMTNPMGSNPYSHIIDEEERSKKIIETAIPKYKNANDPLVIKAIKMIKEVFIKELSYYKLYNTAMKLAEKLKRGLDNLDPMERTKTGSFVLKPSDVMAAIERIGPMMDKLKKAHSEMYEEYKSKGRVRGGREINPFEI